MMDEREREEQTRQEQPSGDEYSGTLASGAPEPAPEAPVDDETSQTSHNDLARRTGGGSG